MSIPPEVRAKVYTLRAAALTLALLGVAGVFLSAPDSGLFFLGLAGGIAGLWLVRRANAVVLKAQGQVVAKWSLTEESKRVGRSMWTLTVVSLAACVVFYFAMDDNQIRGVWPVYAFAIAGLWAAANVGYVCMKVFGASTIYWMSGQRPPGPQ